MAKYYFPIILHKEDKGYSVFVPDLEGCNTQGATVKEAYEMASNAIGLCLCNVTESEYPQTSNPEKITLEKNELLRMVYFDRMNYDKKNNNNKPVKKTLTIPAWLDELAKKEHVNFSGIFHEALIEKLKIS